MYGHGGIWGETQRQREFEEAEEKKIKDGLLAEVRQQHAYPEKVKEIRESTSPEGLALTEKEIAAKITALEEQMLVALQAHKARYSKMDW